MTIELAVNMDGVRFGKGHGFVYLEWAMLHNTGVISKETQTTAVVHDCQVLDQPLKPEGFDTVCDTVITPTQGLEVREAEKSVCAGTRTVGEHTATTGAEAVDGTWNRQAA